MEPLGLPDGELLLLDYQPEWPAALRGGIGPYPARPAVTCLLGVEHVGSTSIPGLAAKPILDIMPLLVSFEEGFDIVPKHGGPWVRVPR